MSQLNLQVLNGHFPQGASHQELTAHVRLITFISIKQHGITRSKIRQESVFFGDTQPYVDDTFRTGLGCFGMFYFELGVESTQCPTAACRQVPQIGKGMPRLTGSNHFTLQLFTTDKRVETVKIVVQTLPAFRGGWRKGSEHCLELRLLIVGPKS